MIPESNTRDGDSSSLTVADPGSSSLTVVDRGSSSLTVVDRGSSSLTVVDRGSTSLTTVLLTPVFLVVALMAFQAALWSHARTEARAIARDSAVLVARSAADIDDVERSAAVVLATDTDLADPGVSIDVVDDLVTARITGRAPGLIRGTSVSVEVVEVVPVERFRP